MKWLWGVQLLGVGLWVGAASTAWQTSRLASSGVVRQAVVERTAVYQGVRTVEFAAGAPGDEPLKLQWPSSRATPAVGQTVELRALPDRPEVVVLADEPPDWTPAVLLAVLGLAFVGVPTLVRVIGRRQAPPTTP